MLWLTWVAIACGGRSALDEGSATNDAGGTWHGSSSTAIEVTTGSSTMTTKGGSASAQGGITAFTGGTRAMGGTSPGLGGSTGIMQSHTGGMGVTGGVTHVAVGGSGSGGTSSGSGGTHASGGASAQGGVIATGGTRSVTGGTRATGGFTNTTVATGGAAGSTSTQSSCGADLVLCGAGAAAKCVDTSKDRANCGGCGHACTSGSACSNGQCALPRCQPNFRMGALPTVETDSEAVAFAVGDLNGDSHLDAATANSSANTVSVLLGDGKGGFSQPIEYSVGNNPQAIAIGDFNRDGKQDLVAANADDATVSVLLGKGDGSYEAASYSVGDGPRAVVVDDLDSNGSVDIITVNRDADSVSIWLGMGNGTFATRVDAYAGSYPDQIVVGDFNEDGKTDLITNGGPSLATVLLGVGNGAFLPATAVSADADVNQAYSLALADLNGDNKQDLVVGRSNGRWMSGTFGVLFGSGDGTFLPMVPYEPGEATPIASADLDGDNKAELVVSDGGVTLRIISVNADGSLASTVIYTAPAPPKQITIGDFNGDQWPDIASLNRWGIYLLMGTGNGKFDAPRLQPPKRPSPYNILLRDLNGDDKLDLVGISSANDASTASISVQRGLGNGTFAEVSEYSIRSGDGLIEAGDLDGDGYPDLVTANNAESGVSVLWNAGDASYPTKTDYPTAARTDFLALGDMDNDGTTDIVAANVSWTDSSTVTVLLNQGHGVFVSKLNIEQAGALALADVNQDGRLDLLLSKATSYGGLTVWLGLGDGTFGTRLESPTNELGIALQRAALGDLNGDDILDLALPDGALNVMLGGGDGTFSPLAPQWVADNYDLGRLTLGDLNGDGILDLVSHGHVSWVGYEIIVLLGAGDGTFTCATALPAGAEGEYSALGDVNGDGRLDLVVPSGSNQPTVLFNQPL